MLEHAVIKRKIKKNIRFPVLFCGCVPLSNLFGIFDCRKTRDLGYPCKTATCHIWSHFYGTGKLLWHYSWSLLCNLANCLSWILDTVPRLVLRTFNLPTLADLNICTFLCHTAYGSKSSFISRTTFCPITLHPFTTSLDNLLVANDTWLLQTATNKQGYTPTFQLDRLSQHYEL